MLGPELTIPKTLLHFSITWMFNVSTSESILYIDIDIIEIFCPTLLKHLFTDFYLFVSVYLNSNWMLSD